MIKVKYKERGNSYILTVDNLLSDKDDLVRFKFDTGAVHTVLSQSWFVGENNQDFVDKLNYNLESISDNKITFTAASGHTLNGYLSCKSDVKINGVVFKKFYFYLINDTKRPLALIGDDFISNCSFVHKIKSDIDITAFDFDNYYKEGENQGDVCDLDSILEMTYRGMPHVRVGNTMKTMSFF